METLDDLIQQHNTTYKTISIRVSEELFDWLRDMSAKMKVSRAKLTELMFNYGYEHFVSQTKNGGNGTSDNEEKKTKSVEQMEIPGQAKEEAVGPTAP